VFAVAVRSASFDVVVYCQLVVIVAGSRGSGKQQHVDASFRKDCCECVRTLGTMRVYMMFAVQRMCSTKPAVIPACDNNLDKLTGSFLAHLV
jgi:hypothetical protein